MDKDHVAAVIERHLEGIQVKINMHRLIMDSYVIEKKTWDEKRLQLLEGASFSEKELRDIYRELVGVIILGAD